MCSCLDRVIGALLLVLGLERLASALWLDSARAVSTPLLAGTVLLLGGLIVSASGGRRQRGD